MQPKGIIFDIGRVIVRVNLKRAFEGLDTDGPSRDPAKIATMGIPLKTKESIPSEGIWDAIQTDERWRDWQEGRMTPQSWHEHITRRLQIPLGFTEFCAAWNRVLEPETILPESLFSQLGAHHQLALLSNTDPLHSARLEERFPFIHHFPVRIYSCAVGSSKPSPTIYEAVLAAMRLSPAQALYIDDIPEFAGAARALGMDAICFENPAQFTAEMARRSLPEV